MIELCSLMPEHESLVLQWRNAPGVAENMYTDRKITMDEHHAWFTKMLEVVPRTHWLVSWDGRPVGIANTAQSSGNDGWVYFGLYIADEVARMAGIGSAAEFLLLDRLFFEASYRKVCCEAFSFNAQAISLHKRLGFHVDGVLRQHILRSGEYRDVTTLSLLKSEWEQARAELEPVIARLHKLRPSAAEPNPSIVC